LVLKGQKVAIAIEGIAEILDTEYGIDKAVDGG